MKFGLRRDEVEIRGPDLEPWWKVCLEEKTQFRDGIQGWARGKVEWRKTILIDPMWLGFFKACPLCALGLSTWSNAAHLSQQVRTCHGFLLGCPPTPLFAMQGRSSPFSQEMGATNKMEDCRAEEVGGDGKYESSTYSYYVDTMYYLA